MKKWIFMCIGVIAACALFVSCDYKIVKDEPQNGFDRQAIYEVVDSYMNPTFTNVDDVLVFHDDLCEEEAVMKVFKKMSNETLKTVCTVLTNRLTPLTINSIVTEYTTGRNIYDNLPPEDIGDDQSFYDPTSDIAKDDQTALQSPSASKDGVPIEEDDTKASSQPATNEKPKQLLWKGN